MLLQIAIDDEVYQRACQLADIKPTPRQLSKWRNQQGEAYTQRYKAKAVIRNRLKKSNRWRSKEGA